MISTENSQHLNALFLSDEWKAHLRTLSDAAGFNLSIYSEQGELIFSTEDYIPMCRGLLSSPEFKSKCDTYCRVTMMSSIEKNKPVIYKCYAKIMSFSIPVEYFGEKAVIVGQGSFSTYEDFLEFAKLLALSKVKDFPVTGPLKFISAEQAKNACRFVSSSVNQLLKNAQETLILKQKTDRLKAVLGMWGFASREKPETLYKYMIANLFSLLDLKEIAVFSLDRAQGAYVGVCSLKRADKGINGHSISERDIIVQEILRNKSFVSSMEPLMGVRADFLKDIKTFYFFPIFVDHELESILGIFESPLKEADIKIVNAFCVQTAIALENQKLHFEMHAKVAKFATISELTSEMASVFGWENLLQMILNKSTEFLKAEQGSLMILNKETEVLLLEARKGIAEGITEKLKIQKGEGIAGRVVELGEPFLVEDIESDPRINQKNRLRYKTKSFISVPIKIDDRVIGVLNIADKTTGEVFNEEDLKFVQSFATQAAVVIERNMLYKQAEELKKLSITDALTGLLNRRYLHSRLEEEMLRSERHARPLSLLMLDIDGFKGYNDAFGHPMGDRALKIVADRVLNSVRSIDIVSRYGGDEFMVILPETDKTLAQSIAERLRIDMAETEMPPEGLPAPWKFTASIGIVSYPENGKTIDLLLENVDRALYNAKNKGGNRIEVFS
ncbi:MAG: diguanylate cyclase [Nitrospirae bacterium]|nr:diguanylate cyclase [Nitrospirota bacterium]